MFQPVPMAKVAIVGPKTQLAPTVDTLHRLNLLHIEDFTASEDKTFDLGSPLPGGSKVSERLVRVRGVMKGAQIAAPKDARPFTIENLRALEERLKEVEDELARLVESRDKADDEIKTLEEEAATLARIQNLTVPTRLLSGYKNVATASGFVATDADLGALRALSQDLEILESTEAEGTFIAVFAPKAVEKALGEALAKLGFTPFEAPAHDVPPAQARQHLEGRKAEASARRDQLNEKIAAIRERHGAAFFALDEYLSIEADKATSPVRFRTTAHSFMIEGWIPHDAYARLEQAVGRAAKNQVYVTRLQRAALSHAAPAHHGAEHDEHGDAHAQAAEPPVMLKNANVAGPYELLTDTYSRPKYGELDPTFFMTIGFPFFFGMMLGDVGYGLIVLIMVFTGVFNGLYKVFGFQSKWHLNKIFLHSAISTILFGLLYGEVFGFEFYGSEGIWTKWESHLGPIPLPLSRLHEVKLLLALSLLVGVIHLFVGLVLGMRNAAAEHGMGGAIKHRGSWLCILIAVALAGFAVVPSTLGLGEAHAEDAEHGAEGADNATVETHQEAVEEHDSSSGLLLWAALVFFIVGVVLLVMGEGGIALLELPTVVSNLLSYTRLVAIGLSGVGIALAGNKVAGGMISGTIPGGAATGVVTAILFHLMGVLLGILGPALHALRLHYVEFFTKFYTGGGTIYQPFGAQRKYTVQEVKQA